MPQFNAHHKEELSEGNRYYWRIPKGLPSDYKEATMEFILHNKRWIYEAFYTYDKHFRLSFRSISADYDDSTRFGSVRGGIIDHDRKELAALKADYYVKNGIVHFIIGNVISKSELCGMMMAKKVLYIFVEMKSGNDEKPQLIQEKTAFASKVENDFKEMLLSGTNSDVAIQVKRKKFMCHRCILSARSPVFSAMMEHDIKEKASGVVTIKDAEPTPFQEFLLYLYTGNQEHLNWENLTDLYTLADKYGVADLKSLCVKQIKENLTVVNFYEFFLLSRKYNDPEMKNVTVDFFLEHSKEIIGSDNWMTFLSKNLVECNVLITALANK